MSRRGVLGGAALSKQVDDFLSFVRKDVRAESFFRRRLTEATTAERKAIWISLWQRYCDKYRKKENNA